MTEQEGPTMAENPDALPTADTTEPVTVDRLLDLVVGRLPDELRDHAITDGIDRSAELVLTVDGATRIATVTVDDDGRVIIEAG